MTIMGGAQAPVFRHGVSEPSIVLEEYNTELDSLRDWSRGDSCFHYGPLLGGHSVVAVPPASIPV
jgi:hypothetical protein